jgi:hypothetical protein
MRKRLMIPFSILLICTPAVLLFSQVTVDMLHGDQNWSAYGLHSGNQIKTHFWNDGQIGIRRHLTDQIGGEWPINSGEEYMAKVSTFYSAEVRGTDGVIRHIVSESNGTRTGQQDMSSGDYDLDTGLWWCMTPLPGFLNPNPPPEETDLPWVAMSHKTWSWPGRWPDKEDDTVDPGWPGSWNGYFGKDKQNAEQESYYVMDDYNNREFPFYPDSTNLDRRGLGLRVTVRGFQWSHVIVEDIIFWLFDAKNVGTHLHDKMAFGVMSGADIGGHGDSSDDGGAYNLQEDLGYQYDDDRIGDTGWQPVGYLGLAFLESPGNSYDGIDNDGDGHLGSGPTISVDMFDPVIVNAGDPIIMIDYITFERNITTMPPGGAVIHYLDREETIMPGELVEIANNLIDDNLNGIIDENNGSIYGEGETAVVRYLFDGLKYIDYYTGEGSDNPLIDEERNNFIDDDGDWDVLNDDVGLDGVDETGDPGEGDGVPTSGFGTDLPGEPHIDKTDIDETDMIGLTSFFIFTDLNTYGLQNDENLWQSIVPGELNALGQIANTDIILGSAYFPMKPDEIQRFSIAYIMGNPLDDLFRNKDNALTAYHANYKFFTVPELPTVTAYAEDGTVTLLWDDAAERSFDPLTGYDFEGYRIYRSTDPEWLDMAVVTDGHGARSSRREPIAQFDLDDKIKGWTHTGESGIQFWLGDDTGLVHKYVDSTVTNGQTYYYAVTSYDRGADSLGVFPGECIKYLNITRDGKIDKGVNVVVIRPEAPPAGFVNAGVNVHWKEGSTSNGTVTVPIVNSTAVQNKTYQIVFQDTLVKDRLWLVPYTRNFSLLDVTDGAQDTLISRSKDFGMVLSIPGDDGLQFVLENQAALTLNEDSTGWNDPNVYAISFKPAYLISSSGTVAGTYQSHDYMMVIGDPGLGMSTQFDDFAAVPVNFKLYNLANQEEVAFYFQERDGDGGLLTAFGSGATSDRVYFLEPDADGNLVTTIQWEMVRTGADSLTRQPQAGDTLWMKLDKPFLSHDVIEFTSHATVIDEELAKSDLDKIKVVPNPYVVGNSWEPLNLYSTGRGPRELHFIHLPMECTIRIFNIQGQLVQTLEHQSTLYDGTLVWDMLTKDKLDIAFGVYIYHVDAPGLGTKIGKFAVIK